MIPFSISTYYNQQTGDQSPTYRTGYVGIYHKDIKYPSNGDGPLKLAYASESFVEDHNGITAVLIYEVNKDYVPSDPKLIVQSNLLLGSRCCSRNHGFGTVYNTIGS